MGARELSYAEAIREALAIALAGDERVFLMGEDIGVYGGAFQVTGDLVDRFGEERVMDTPISELGGAGVAVGAALTGMRPVYEFQFSDFSMLAMEQIVNQAAKLRYMLGGAVHVPVVFRMPTGSGLGGAAQHSQSIEAWFAHVPGLKVVEPSTPEDVKGMLLAAIKDPDPVIVFEHKLLYKMKGAVPEGAYETPLDKAIVRREGRDLTIVATAIMVHRALEAAEILAKEGIDAEVIDLRSLEADRQAGDHRQRQEDGAASGGLRGRRRRSASGRRSRRSSPKARPSTISRRRSCGSAASKRRFPTVRCWRRRRCRRSTTSSRRRGGSRAARSRDGARDRHAAGRHGHDDRPHGRAGARAEGARVVKGETAVRDRDRQGGDGGRCAGFGRAALRRRVRGRRAAGRRLHRLDRRRGRGISFRPRRRRPPPVRRRRRMRSGAGRRNAKTRLTPTPRRPARDARRPSHRARAGLRLSAVRGSGPSGRIQKRDHRSKRARRRAAGRASVNREWLRRGEGAPIVFIHGLCADLNGWRPLFRVSAGDAAALAIDLPGHGLCPLGEDASFEALVEAARSVMIEEGATSAHLVGHSLGGAVAAALSQAPGVKALSLMLIAPAGLGEETNPAFFDGFLQADTRRRLCPG